MGIEIFRTFYLKRPEDFFVNGKGPVHGRTDPLIFLMSIRSCFNDGELHPLTHLQIFQRQGDKVVAEIKLAVQKTYDSTHPSHFVRNTVQHLKL